VLVDPDILVRSDLSVPGQVHQDQVHSFAAVDAYLLPGRSCDGLLSAQEESPLPSSRELNFSTFFKRGGTESNGVLFAPCTGTCSRTLAGAHDAEREQRTDGPEMKAQMTMPWSLTPAKAMPPAVSGLSFSPLPSIPLLHPSHPLYQF
jgi:hypothetical protein